MHELKFDEHLGNVCLKANRKSTTLKRILKYLDFNKIRILDFLNSNSNTPPLRGVL